MTDLTEVDLEPSYWAVKSGWHKVYHLDANSMITPGLADAHAHTLGNGFAKSLDLAGSQSVDGIIA